MTLRHVNAATTQSMGTASTLSDKVRSLSFIQKAVLLAVFLAGKKKDRSVRGALKEFDVVARKLGIPVPSRTELSDILMTLSTYVLVSRESKGRIATPKETDPLRIELSDAQLKVGLDDPLATEDAEGKGNKALMNIFEAWEREEKRKAVLGGEGTDLVDD